jgi:hypothetical protein
LAGTVPELDNSNTENYTEMKKEAEERKLHRMAKVHHILEMWQSSQTYVLHRRNLALKTGRLPPWDTFRTPK